MARSPQLVLDGAVLAAGWSAPAEAVIVVHRWSVRSSTRRWPSAAGAFRPGTDPGPNRGGPVRRRRGQRCRALDRAGRPRAHRDAAAAIRAGPGSQAHAGAERRDSRAPRAYRAVRRIVVPVGRYADEPGSMLVTVLGAVREPCVLEIAIGTPVGRVLELAGGASAPLQALLLGGYFGDWVGGRGASLPFSSAGLADLGAGTGAGPDRGAARRRLRARGDRQGGPLPGR